MKLAFAQARRGVVAHCPGLALTVHAQVRQSGARIVLTCDLDCSYVAQLYRLPGKLVVSKRGRVTGNVATTLPLRVPKAKGRYRLRLSAVAPVNPGRASLRVLALHAPG